MVTISLFKLNKKSCEDMHKYQNPVNPTCPSSGQLTGVREQNRIAAVNKTKLKLTFQILD